jgi:UDP-N-acetylglucosamine 2-epimerase (non-hydrolysing)
LILVLSTNPMLDEGRVANADGIPYEDARFDVVFSDNVLEHLDEPLQVFREVARVLKPGGVFLFKTPNKWHYMPTIARLTPHGFHQYVNRLRGRAEVDTFPTRYRANCLGDIKRLASDAGLLVERVERIEGRPEYLRMTWLKRIDLIAGARPNFMKIAPIIDALKAAEGRGGASALPADPHRPALRQGHVGQLFRAARHSRAGYQSGGGLGHQAEQTAAIMVRYEKVLLEQRSDLCLVVGDVTSTMACSIAARKCGVPVAHVEGGIRSGDWTMPEEINRVVTDSISNWFFTTSEVANANLRQRRGGGGADLLRRQHDDRYAAQADAALACAGVSGRSWAWSRGSTSWSRCTGRRMWMASSSCWRCCGRLPRARRAAGGVPGASAHGEESAGAWKGRSGGHALRGSAALPGVQLPGEARQGRDHRFGRHYRGNHGDGRALPDAARQHRAAGNRDGGTNELIGTDPAKLGPALARLMAGQWKKGGIPEKWDGKAAERIVAELANRWRRSIGTRQRVKPGRGVARRRSGWWRWKRAGVRVRNSRFSNLGSQ